MPTRNNNRRKAICVSRPLSMKQEGKLVGGVHITIVMHRGFNIFKMAAKVEKSYMLYYSIDTVLSLDRFTRFDTVIFV